MENVGCGGRRVWAGSEDDFDGIIGANWLSGGSRSSGGGNVGDSDVVGSCGSGDGGG